MSFADAYESLAEAADSPRWAFGTGFEEPLAGVDTAVPDGVDRADLEAYCVMLADDALVMSHRLQEWCTNLPGLEDEVAVANIALDLLGQGRLLLARAGSCSGRGEDDYAYGRESAGYRNVRLVEPAREDFAELVSSVLVFSSWRLAVCSRLAASTDPMLAAIAAKAVNELTYHRDYAARWLVRLGAGTELSHARAESALRRLWPLVGELFDPHPVERRLGPVAFDPAEARDDFDRAIGTVLEAAGLDLPDVVGRQGVAGRAGRDGVHTEALSRVLAEMQSVARAHPGAAW